MQKTRLLAAALFAVAMTMPAFADIIDDPLHIQCSGCIDNGTNTPLPTGQSTFGFSSSPPGASGTLFLEVLIPNTVNLGSFVIPSVSGFANGTPALFSTTAWTTGTQNAFLGGSFNVNASPDNGIGAYLPSTDAVDPGATGFFAFLLNAGSATLGGPGDPLTDTFTLGGNLPTGAYVIAMLLTTDNHGNPMVINTANSGAGFINQLQSPVPLPGALWLFGTGLVGMTVLSRRRREKQAAV